MLNSVFSWRNFSFASPVRLAPLLTKPSYVFCSSWASSPFSCNWSFLFVYGFYTSKKFFIQTDVVAVFGQYGHHFFCQFLHLVTGLGTHQIAENSSYAV